MSNVISVRLNLGFDFAFLSISRAGPAYLRLSQVSNYRLDTAMLENEA